MGSGGKVAGRLLGCYQPMKKRTCAWTMATWTVGEQTERRIQTGELPVEEFTALKWDKWIWGDVWDYPDLWMNGDTIARNRTQRKKNRSKGENEMFFWLLKEAKTQFNQEIFS